MMLVGNENDLECVGLDQQFIPYVPYTALGNACTIIIDIPSRCSLWRSGVKPFGRKVGENTSCHSSFDKRVGSTHDVKKNRGECSNPEKKSPIRSKSDLRRDRADDDDDCAWSGEGR